MRPLHAFLMTISLAAAIGCSLIGKNSGQPRPTTPLAKVNAEQLVSYLNERASRLQSINSEIQLTAREGLLSGNLRGDLAARQPRDFRMTAQGSVAGKVDLGSNFEQFWIYFNAPTSKPLFVYASHTQFESGRAPLPGGLPFEPEWVMQALGMHVYPTSVSYNAPVSNQSDRTWTLSWPAKTPSGVAIVKEVVFDADNTREGQPIVKKHIIRDTNKKLICSAEVKSVKSIPVGSPDPNSPQVLVQYPTHIVLNWPTEKFELDLHLENSQVNQRLSEEQTRGFFTRPNNLGVQPYDLAQARYDFR